jgi:hypothetical protein
MGRSESDWNSCRKHPRHKNSTGVCPYCLRERLVHLSSPPFSFLNLACSSSTSSTPFYSSESDLSSLSESPTYEKVQDTTISFRIKDNKQLGGAFPIKRSEPLLKSRSLIHVIGRKDELGDDDRRLRLEKGKKEKMEDDKEEKKEKKASFWSKLLKGGMRREEKGEKNWVLEHSRTLKEKPADKWVHFA